MMDHGPERFFFFGGKTHKHPVVNSLLFALCLSLLKGPFIDPYKQVQNVQTILEIQSPFSFLQTLSIEFKFF
jgi:hypothetical protein